MGKRREGREAAVQYLFQCDSGAETDDADLSARFWEMRPSPQSTRDFATPLIRGVLENMREIDEIISKYAANYELNRISTVDRNVLRLAIFEMYHRFDIPPVVSINEAIELAKTFGTDESGRFVNGILDRVKLELKRPLRTTEKAAPKAL